jgi:SAM-dependent methyltransferase
LGPLPRLHWNLFGGQRLGRSLEAGRLWRCPQCDLRFRYPYLPQNELTDLYKDLPPSVWGAQEPRKVWREIVAYCDRFGVRKSIVDIGCFAGDFLHWLPDGWEKWGIEPAAAARQVAQSRGIQIVGEAIGTRVSLPKKPAVATLIDVLEHMEDPLGALAFIRDLLGDGGLAFIFTGAADSLPWRLVGNDYWYSSLPEHVSFFTRRWFTYAAEKTGMRLRACRYMSSAPFHAGKFCFHFVQIALFTAVQRARRRGWSERRLRTVPVLSRAVGWNTVPWWQEARDHVLVVLER